VSLVRIKLELLRRYKVESLSQLRVKGSRSTLTELLDLCRIAGRILIFNPHRVPIVEAGAAEAV
jgi:hypothetical protein